MSSSGVAIALWKSAIENHFPTRCQTINNSHCDVMALPPKCDLHFGHEPGPDFLATPNLL